MAADACRTFRIGQNVCRIKHRFKKWIPVSTRSGSCRSKRPRGSNGRLAGDWGQSHQQALAVALAHRNGEATGNFVAQQGTAPDCGGVSGHHWRLLQHIAELRGLCRRQLAMTPGRRRIAQPVDAAAKELLHPSLDSAGVVSECVRHVAAAVTGADEQHAVETMLKAGLGRMIEHVAQRVAGRLRFGNFESVHLSVFRSDLITFSNIRQ